MGHKARGINVIYPYRCPDCERQFDRVCSLFEYEHEPQFFCPICEVECIRVITPVRSFVTGKFEPFISPVDGSVITCSHDLQEHNKRNNVVNLHDGYDEKAVEGFTKRAWNQTPEAERKKDLSKDMEQAIQKLESGYKPTPAEYTEEIPNG